jgi:hypothetical protein
MIKSERAASEVIGMVMIVSIMMLVIGSIMLVGVPMIESGKASAKMDVAMNSFLSLQNDIEEVVRGPIWMKDPSSVTNVQTLGPSRDTEFQLMGGTLSVVSNVTVPNAPIFMLLNVTNLTVNKQNNITIAGGITYKADQDEIAYENGAVIRKYETGAPLLLSNPLITVYNTLDNTTNRTSNISVSIHAINLSGTRSSTGGDGKAWIETRPVNYSQIIEPGFTPNTNQINITIYSKYPEAWESFLDAQLQEAGLVRQMNPTNQTGYYINISSALDVRIYGNYNSTRKDIYLSVYKSDLDVRVR